VTGVDDGGESEEDDEGGSEGSDATDAAAATSSTDTATDAEVDPAEDWRAALRETGRLTPAIVNAIVSTHSRRGQRAIEAVSEGRVKRYRDFTVVVGYDDEYIVEEGQCTCKDAEYNLDQSDPRERCWHSLAVDVADALGEVDYHDMWYSEVREFL
jgi:predicted nucleic acid-binding Zn finger protein